MPKNIKDPFSQERLQRAELLFDAIGELDDSLIQEAHTFGAKRRPQVLRRVILIAASLVLSLTLLLSLAIGAYVAQKNGERTPSSPTTNAIDYSSIQSSFVSIKGLTAQSAVPLDSVDLMSSSPKIIWKYNGESDYRTSELSPSSANRLSSLMKSGYTLCTPHSAGEKSELEGVWICFGGGMVCSPCLKPSNGNIAFGSLFEYDPEIEPSAEFTRAIINEIVNKT